MIVCMYIHESSYQVQLLIKSTCDVLFQASTLPHQTIVSKDETIDFLTIFHAIFIFSLQ